MSHRYIAMQFAGRQLTVTMLRTLTDSVHSVITLCSKKSDARIQITITTAHLTRINYPINTFSYRLSGTNIANFNKIHHMVSEQQLFKQVAQLSQRDRAAGWVSYRVAVGPERTGTPFRFFFGQPERRSCSFFHSSQQCIRKWKMLS